MKALYTQSVIDKEIATFWLNLQSEGDSYVTFGGVPGDAMTGDTYTQDLIQKYDVWWTVSLGSVKLGGQSIKSSGTKYAILDTGTSLLTMS